MSITAAKVRAPLMRLCAAPVVPGPCNPVPAADVPALPVDTNASEVGSPP